MVDTYIIQINMPNDGLLLTWDDSINQAKGQGYFYEHLDFEHECTFDERKRIPFILVELDDLT